MASEKINVDVNLLKKYDRPGPRYTSYPTAPHFHDGIGTADYTEYVSANDRLKNDQDISVYFHLPFCDTLCYFCGCNMMVTRHPERIDEYIQYLIKEMDIFRQFIGSTRRIAQLHWGGGTPTSLSPVQIRRLGAAIRDRFQIKDNAELSVEIDPRDLTKDHMVALKDVGFTRCSMGVQDFDEKVQKAVNRIQPEDITRRTVAWARELGFESINLDLMYGLPFQTTDNFSATIDKALSFDPDRFAVFNYAHLPQMIKHQRLIKDDTLPAPDVKLQLLKLSIEQLTEAGYVYIGMDHFAKPDDELTIAMNKGTLHRNFQGYSTYAGLDLFAFGVSSISLLPDLYVQNHKKLKLYYEKLEGGELPIMRGYRLNEDDRLRRDVIMELMCNFRLIKSTIERKYGISFDVYFAESIENLKHLEKDDLVIIKKDRIEVTSKGRLLIRNVVMNFDAYLGEQTGKGPQYSRTV